MRSQPISSCCPLIFLWGKLNCWKQGNQKSRIYKIDPRRGDDYTKPEFLLQSVYACVYTNETFCLGTWVVWKHVSSIKWNDQSLHSQNADVSKSAMCVFVIWMTLRGNSTRLAGWKLLPMLEKRRGCQFWWPFLLSSLGKNRVLLVPFIRLWVQCVVCLVCVVSFVMSVTTR